MNTFTATRVGTSVRVHDEKYLCVRCGLEKYINSKSPLNRLCGDCKSTDGEFWNTNSYWARGK